MLHLLLIGTMTLAFNLRGAQPKSEKLRDRFSKTSVTCIIRSQPQGALAQRYFDQACASFSASIIAKPFGRSARRLSRSRLRHGPLGDGVCLGPHVNKPMDSNDTVQAWSALQLAIQGKAQAPLKEQAYIAALEKRYQPQHQDDRQALDKAFAAAMRQLAKEYPDDLDAQVLFAESLMNTMPWDYWTRDRRPKPETEEILSVCVSS